MSYYKPGIVNGDIIVKLESEIESLKKENEELQLLRTSDYNRIERLESDLENKNSMLRELTYRSHKRLPEDNEAARWFDEGGTIDFTLRHWSLIEQIEGKL